METPKRRWTRKICPPCFQDFLKKQNAPCRNDVSARGVLILIDRRQWAQKNQAERERERERERESIKKPADPMGYCVLHIENTRLHTNLLSCMQLPNKWQGT